MDKHAWQNILKGDHLAYAQVYHEYFKKFHNYGKKFTSDTALIEDSIQEVFLEIWNKKERIAEIDSPNSYFFSAFRFILLEKIKQLKRTLQANYTEDDIEFSPELEVIARETDSHLNQKLADALQSLTPRQREAIFLRFYEGLSYEEVASILNITVKATYKIMARSLTSLKDQIAISLMAVLFLRHLFRP
jgi:RNA polymerase sigma factor (sigma-70 family)